MKAIVNTGPNHLTLLDYPVPEPGPGQVRIRTVACGICATDLHFIAGTERTRFPNTPGHEWSGIVDAVGPDVKPELLGQHCVADNFLTDGGEVGFEHPGGYGQYLLTEARNVRVLPTDFPVTTAALIEPLAVVTRALKNLRPGPRHTALVSGDGPIGLLSLMLLRRAGVEQIGVIGGRNGRLDVARTLGATATFNFLQLGDGLISAIQREINGPISAVVETSGSAAGLETALKLIANQGQIILVGDYGAARANFPWNLILQREIVLVGSNAGGGAWDEAVRMAVEERLPLDRLITHKFPGERFEEAFSLVRSQRDDVVKIVLEW